MPEPSKKFKKCRNCGKDIEVDPDTGHYVCEDCGWDESKARQRVRQRMLEHEVEEDLKREAKKGAKKDANSGWTW